MGKRRMLGSVDPLQDSRNLLKKIKVLQDQMLNVYQTSVGVQNEFNLQNEILTTNHNSIYVSGSDHYLYINGTDEFGQYGVYQLDVRNGGFYVERTPDPTKD
jgi:hypothetical protein